jgi:hypothetical protein
MARVLKSAGVSLVFGAALLVGSDSVFSQTPSICVSNQGEIRFIGLPGLPVSCPQGWRNIPFPSTGPRGPRGPIGVTGPTGPQGLPGSPGGLHCWDLNNNGQADMATEDRNNDNALSAADCRGPDGPRGPAGPAGPRGNGGPVGAVGPAGPTGPAGPVGPQGIQGPVGPAVSTSCLAQIGGGSGMTTSQFCANACNGSNKVVVAVSNFERSCSVTSDTGRCDPGWGTNQRSYCCVCRP